jgi:hypothetical protein
MRHLLASKHRRSIKSERNGRLTAAFLTLGGFACVPSIGLLQGSRSLMSSAR